jgi:hypothetical protein
MIFDSVQLRNRIELERFDWTKKRKKKELPDSVSEEETGDKEESRIDLTLETRFDTV